MPEGCYQLEAVGQAAFANACSWPVAAVADRPAAVVRVLLANVCSAMIADVCADCTVLRLPLHSGRSIGDADDGPLTTFKKMQTAMIDLQPDLIDKAQQMARALKSIFGCKRLSKIAL